MLSSPLREVSETHRHLSEYLHLMPLDRISIPSFHASLDSKLKDLTNPNLIYPISEEVFVHILSDPTDARDFYIPVEPGVGQDFNYLMDEIEVRLVDMVCELEKADTSSEDRRELLLRSLHRVTTTRGADRRNGESSNGSNHVVTVKGGKIVLTEAELETIKYILVRDKNELGLLQPFIEDPYIEDVGCSGVGPLFVEHKIFRSLKSSTSFSNSEDLDDFVIRLSEKIGKPVTFRNPIVDAALPDGSRINIVFGDDVSKRGSNFSIRKFTTTPLSIIQLIEFGSLSYEMAAYLSLVMGEGMNVFVVGETASGKTTMLNALTTFIAPSSKIVSIEDTPELQVPHPNWTREVVRGSAETTGGSTVTMFDLLRAALRQRPNEIIIGEIRGEEGAIAFQAMQTGHAAMATFHASSVEKLIQRLTGDPINIPKSYIDNLNVVVIQSAVRLPNGQIGRRVLSINEIVGYDSASDSFSFIEVFRWDPAVDRFEFRGYMQSYLLEEKIAPKRGIPSDDKKTIYGELERRARVLQRLHQQNVRDFYELYSFLAQAYRKGVFR
jgi:flagellar protein FlaI